MRAHLVPPPEGVQIFQDRTRRGALRMQSRAHSQAGHVWSFRGATPAVRASTAASCPSSNGIFDFLHGGLGAMRRARVCGSRVQCLVLQPASGFKLTGACDAAGPSCDEGGVQHRMARQKTRQILSYPLKSVFDGGKSGFEVPRCNNRRRTVLCGGCFP